VPCRLERPASLLLDIDTGADLQELRGRLAGAGPRAARTRELLGSPAAGAGAASAQARDTATARCAP
jgi:hypothetical protein